MPFEGTLFGSSLEEYIEVATEGTGVSTLAIIAATLIQSSCPQRDSTHLQVLSPHS